MKSSKIDTKRYAEALTQTGTDMGERCTTARNSDEGDVIAAAICLSLLVSLRSMASAKVLTGANIQAVIDSFYNSSNVVERRTPMGGIIYERAGS